MPRAFHYTALVLILLTLLACRETSRLSTEGESCSRTADCEEPLRCVEQKCADLQKATAMHELQERQRKKDDAQILLMRVASRLEMHVMRYDEYPPSLEALSERGGPVRQDPWGTSLAYAATDDGFWLCSAGSDKVMGSDDDLCYDRIPPRQ